MQISTIKTDYIVDTLELWDNLQPLNEIFCNPKIVKVKQVFYEGFVVCKNYNFIIQ